MNPRYKASLTQSIFALIDDLPASERDRIYGLLGPEVTNRVHHATKTDWLPVTIQGDLDTAMLETLGRERTVALLRGYTRDATKVPIFAPIGRAALSLFGGGTGGALRVIPRTWGFVAKDCGSMKVHVEPSRASVHYLDIPPVLRTPGFVASTEGSLLGIMDFAGADSPKATPDESNFAQGTLAYEVTWKRS